MLQSLQLCSPGLLADAVTTVTSSEDKSPIFKQQGEEGKSRETLIKLRRALETNSVVFRLHGILYTGPQVCGFMI